MPQLNIKRTTRRVEDPLQKVFDPGPADTSVQDALVGLGRDITSAAGSIDRAVKAKNNRDDQIDINKARLEYAAGLTQLEKDIFADDSVKSGEALDSYILKSQELSESISGKHKLSDPARSVFNTSTVSSTTNGINNLSKAFQARDNNAVVQTIAEAETAAQQSVVINPTPENALRLINDISNTIDGYAANPLIDAGVFGRAGASSGEVKDGIVNGIY